jgi:uncharacterized protein DUF2844
MRDCVDALRLVRYTVIWLLVVAALPAAATLGENVNSINSDQARLKASVRIVPKQFYSVHEMQTPSGTAIRQFVSPDGTVFGVAWQGFAPNLEQLLGNYFQDYLHAASAPGRRGRGVHIDNGDLVFDSGGHMRYVTGRAFLRSRLPSGVTASDVQ